MIIPHGLLGDQNTGPSYTITENDSLEFDTANGQYTQVLMLTGTRGLVTYKSSGSDGKVTLFSLDGSLNITSETTQTFDTTLCNYNSICHITGNYYAIVYQGNAAGLYVQVIEVNLFASSITLTQNTASLDVIYDLRCCNVDSTHIAVTGRGSGAVGEMWIIEFDGSYNASITDVHTFENNVYYMDISKIDGTHFVISHSGPFSDGYQKVMEIDGSYIISETSDLEYDTTHGTWVTHCQLATDEYAVAYNGNTGSSRGGVIAVLTHDVSFNITNEDELVFETSIGTSSKGIALIQKATNYFVVVAYREEGAGDGFVRLFEIDASTYAITERNSLEFETSDATWVDVALIDDANDNSFIVSYSGVANDGFLKTFTISDL